MPILIPARPDAERAPARRDRGWRGAIAVAAIVTSSCVSSSSALRKPAITPQIRVAVDSQTNHYRVSGATLPAVRESVRANGTASAGSRYAGFHRWNITPSTSGCGRGTIAVRSTILVPKHANEAELTAQDRAEWVRYAEALLAHEVGHRTIILSHVEAVRRRLMVPSVTDCREWKASFTREVNAELVRARAASARLDTLTNHGRSQGASLRLPPQP
jgi:predicted secreted Zn-dependent protease